MVTLKRAILAIGATLSRPHPFDRALGLIGALCDSNRYSAIVVSITAGRTPDADDLNVAFDDNLTPQGAADALVAAGEAIARLHGIMPGRPVIAQSPELVEAARITAEKFIHYCRSSRLHAGELPYFDHSFETVVEELTHVILAASVDDDTTMADVAEVG